MYQLTVNNARVGYVEKPTYIYKSPDGGIIIVGDQEESSDVVATGIIYLGVVYNLPGYNDFEDAEIAYVSEVDAGVVLTSYDQLLKYLNIASTDVDSIVIDHELRTTVLELDLNEPEEDIQDVVQNT